MRFRHSFIISFFLTLVCIVIVTPTFLVNANEVHIPEDYKHLEAAVLAAAPGDTLIVDSGTYKGFDILTKGLSIKSTGRVENTIIKGAVKVWADNVSISGFTFKGVSCHNSKNQVTCPLDHFILIQNARDIVIKDCVFSGQVIKALNLNEVRDAKILNNTFINIRKPLGADSGGQSIRIKQGGNLTVRNNILKDNETGLLIQGAPDNYVERVVIEGNKAVKMWRDAALSCLWCKRVTVVDNYLKSNGKPRFFKDHRIPGIDLRYTHNSKVYNNTVIESSSDGIQVTGKYHDGEVVLLHDVRISNNLLIDNGEMGICTRASRNVQIIDNRIIHTSNCYTGLCGGIYLEWNVSQSIVKNNEILGRGYKYIGISVTSSFANDITNNRITNFRVGIELKNIVEKQEIGGVKHPVVATLKPKPTINNTVTRNEIDSMKFISLINLDGSKNTIVDNVNLRNP